MTAYQLLPPLTPEEFAALKEDIRRKGVLVPIEVDEHGNIIEGHHRDRAVRELREEGLRVACPRVIRPGLTEEQKFEHALVLNLARRHLTRDQKRILAVELRRRFRWSNPRLGRVLGVDQATVYRWFVDYDYNHPDTPLPEDVVGDDQKTYPAQTLGGVLANSEREEMTAREAIQAGATFTHLVSALKAGEIGRRARLDSGTPDPLQLQRLETRSVDLRVGSLTEVLADLEDDSVDLILTDPPYPEEFLPVWTDLALLAERKLKPGRLLITYTGHQFLPQVMDQLGFYLDYTWMAAIFFTGGLNSQHKGKIFTGWRPILWYSKGEYDAPRWVNDRLESGTREKELHGWQQSVEAVVQLIEQHSNPGDLVVDPFLGSGTTAAAAYGLHRRFVGCDVDPGAVAVAQDRLAALIDQTDAEPVAP